MVHVNVFFTDDFRNSTDTRAREKKADQVNTAEMCLKEQEEDAEVRKMWCGLLVHITPTTRSLPTASDVDPSHHTFQIFFVHHCLLSLSRFPCDDDGVSTLLCQRKWRRKKENDTFKAITTNCERMIRFEMMMWWLLSYENDNLSVAHLFV